jgi:hypothetical protein
MSHGRVACLNFFLFHQQIAPLTVIAEFRPPYAPIGEIEEHVGLRLAGRLDAPDCVSSGVITAPPFVVSGELAFQ